jgi:hypothetical protein
MQAGMHKINAVQRTTLEAASVILVLRQACERMARQYALELRVPEPFDPSADFFSLWTLDAARPFAT